MACSVDTMVCASLQDAYVQDTHVQACSIMCMHVQACTIINPRGDLHQRKRLALRRWPHQRMLDGVA